MGVSTVRAHLATLGQTKFGKTHDRPCLHASVGSSLFLFLFFVVVLVLGNFTKGTRRRRRGLPLWWSGVAWPRVRSERSFTHEFIARPLIFANRAFLCLLHTEEVAHAMVMKSTLTITVLAALALEYLGQVCFVLGREAHLLR